MRDADSLIKCEGENFGTLELWNFGTLELWNFGTLELWNFGTQNSELRTQNSDAVLNIGETDVVKTQ
ncbi:hypothetical protein BPAE_0027g00780 [Botrytis paeoniae]|uniref:Bulb-type lectin domain-containing protein n=1 Tax=Botrytis paeoniae TaxID=278948 RepID=A0A4Z1FYZ3_9HELO|nr:hypothetical protein BPAE_0027g00780 [Botrytis paeoniae]